MSKNRRTSKNTLHDLAYTGSDIKVMRCLTVSSPEERYYF